MPFFGGDAQFFHTHRQTQENHRCFSFFVGAGRDSGSGVVNPSHSTTLKCVFIPFFIIYLFLFYTFSFFFVLLLLSPAKLKIETNSQGSHVSPTSKKMIKRKETFPNHCVKEKERKEKKRKINVIRWHAISVLFFFFCCEKCRGMTSTRNKKWNVTRSSPWRRLPWYHWFIGVVLVVRIKSYMHSGGDFSVDPCGC